MKSVRFVTFGCKANQYDTQVLREALVRRGWSEAEREADLVVVNTCTVTAEAGRKARQLIRRVVRENPLAKVAVTGCLATGPRAYFTNSFALWTVSVPGNPLAVSQSMRSRIS